MMKDDAGGRFIQRENHRSGLDILRLKSKRRVTKTVGGVAAIPGQLRHVQVEHALVRGVTFQEYAENFLQTFRVRNIKDRSFGTVSQHQSALIKMENGDVAPGLLQKAVMACDEPSFLKENRFVRDVEPPDHFQGYARIGFSQRPLFHQTVNKPMVEKLTIQVCLGRALEMLNGERMIFQIRSQQRRGAGIASLAHGVVQGRTGAHEESD